MKPTRIRALFVGSILSATLHCHAAAAAESANWPQFRGPNGTGLSPDDQPAPLHLASVPGKAAVVKAADTLEVLAINDLKERIIATPAVLEGKLYIPSEHHLSAFGL